MVRAVPQDQWRLLDVQGHDTRLAQIAHRRDTLPEHAEVARLEARLREFDALRVTAGTAASDIGRELVKAEADVAQVRQRAERDQARLDAGIGTAKDLQATQHELVSLARRQSDLEDAQLEVMERLEEAQSREAQLVAEQAALMAERDQVSARRDEQLAALAAEAGHEAAARESAAAGLPAELLALYDKIREAGGGVGAAKLYQRRCEGCRLELNATDLARLRAAAEDEVLRCEECRRILVRTGDSGL
jgi:uncharacterized protein